MSLSVENELKTVAARWMDEIWQPGSLETYDDLHAVDFTDHSPSGRNQDRAAYRRGIRELYRAFPDFTATTEDLLVDTGAGKVTIRWCATATFQRDFLDFIATGKQVQFNGIEILAIDNGQIHDRWGEWDGMAVLAGLD